MALSSAAMAGGSKDGPVPYKKWHPWLESGGYVSNEDSRSESALFAPLWQSSNALLFVDARGKLFEEADYEGNLAMGVRVMRPSGWNLGAWFGWDNRRSEAGSSFNQVAFGIEALRANFDVRVNGYVPTDDRAHVSTLISGTAVAGAPTSTAVLAGNSLSVVTTTSTTTTTTTTRVFEHALHGIDAEIGFRVPLERWRGGTKDGGPGGAPRLELRLYGGGFWFDNDDVEEIAGPKGRVELRINDVFRSMPGSRLTFEAEAKYDDVRDDQYEAGARLRIPFGLPRNRASRDAALASLNAQERRMMEGLERDTDVVGSSQTTSSTSTSTQVTQTSEGAVDDITGVALNRVAFATDQASLAAAVNQGANTLIIAQGGTVFDLTAAGGQTLQASQTLQGGASTINIRGAITNQVVPFTAPGSKPTMRNTANSAVIRVPDNTHVAGVGITGAGLPSGLTSNRGIRATTNGISNVAITAGTMIMDTGGDGIRFDDNHDKIRIYDTTIANTGRDGIRINDGNTNVTIHNVAINNTLSDGIDIDDNNTNITIRDTTITTTDEDQNGIEIGNNNSTFRIQNATITGAGGIIPTADGDGINIDTGNTGFTIVDTRIVNPNNDGIKLEANNTGIVISNVTITGGASLMNDGIDMFTNNGVTITGTTISNARFEGLFIGGMGNTVAMSTTTFSGTFGDDVIDINAANNTFSGTGNVFNGTFTSNFCEVTGMQTGSFGFAVGPQPTCP